MDDNTDSVSGLLLPGNGAYMEGRYYESERVFAYWFRCCIR